MTGLIRPDEAAYILPFTDTMQGLPTFIDHFAKRPDLARNHKFRVFLAWVSWLTNGAHEVAMGYGTDFFYERMVRALDDAQQGIEMVVREYASQYIDQIEPIDEIGSCNDPTELLLMALGQRSQRIGSVLRTSEIGIFEIRRKLAIAVQLMCIASADPHESVTGDLTTVNLLTAERLFSGGGNQVRLAIGFVLDPNQANHLNPVYPVQVSTDAAACFVWPQEAQSYAATRIFVCRIIDDDDGRRYYVRTDSRPKPRISSVIKLERGARLLDRRGLKLIVVAVQQGDILRSAIRDDAARVVELAKQRLWRSPLREELDTSGRNPYSSQAYWAAKIVGRLEMGPTAAAVEQQITSIADDLNARFATDDLGHKQYRRRVIFEAVLPRWFPESVYGIDWSRIS